MSVGTIVGIVVGAVVFVVVTLWIISKKEKNKEE